MIDLLALAMPHFVMSLAVWRLVRRDDLDNDPLLPRAREAPHARQPRTARRRAKPGTGTGQ